MGGGILVVVGVPALLMDNILRPILIPARSRICALSCFHHCSG